MADGSVAKDWLTWAFSPSISAILLTLLISIISPILFHLWLYKTRSSATLPSFLLLGPSGGGKTSLLTHLEHGHSTPTHTSQEPQTTTCTLRPSTRASSSQYRSQHDPSSQAQHQFQLIDTPGHGKLRHHAYSLLSGSSPSSANNSSAAGALKGIIYVVDAAALSSPAGLTEAATYLHDILLTLQTRQSSSKTSKAPSAVSVLVAANKMDLFTALPAELVKRGLEEEIGKVRRTRSKGLLDSTVGTEGGGNGEEERGWLGEGGDGPFSFEQMRESEVEVRVVGGSVRGDGDGDVEGWWGWIGENL